MEQFDSQSATSGNKLKALSLFKQKMQLKGTLDGVFISVLILFGIIGSLTVLYLQAAQAAEVGVTLTANRQVDKTPSKAVAFQSTTEKLTSFDFVNLQGELKAKSKLTMIIDGYDSAASYTLLTGNGKEIEAKGDQIKFSYAKPGVYYPKMEINFKGETEIVPLDKIWIR